MDIAGTLYVLTDILNGQTDLSWISEKVKATRQWSRKIGPRIWLQRLDALSQKPCPANSLREYMPAVGNGRKRFALSGPTAGLICEGGGVHGKQLQAKLHIVHLRAWLRRKTRLLKS